MKLTKNIFFLLLIAMLSCQNDKKENLKNVKAIEHNSEENKIVQLKGRYNAEEDIWENPDPAFDNRISFDKRLYATFYKLDKEGEVLGIGLINKKGKVIAQPIYSSITIDSLQNDIFQVGNSQDKYGLVNKEGVEISKPQFDFIYLGKEMDSLEIELGIIKVSKDEKKGYINRKGEVVIPMKYYNLSLMGKNLIMFEKTFPTNQEGSISTRWGIMDFNQKMIKDAIFGYPDKLKSGKVTLVVAGKTYTDKGKTYATPGEAYTFYEDGRMEKQ